MKKTILLILILLNINHMCIAQLEQPKVIFEQQNINQLIEQKEDSKTYLTKVSIWTPANMNIFWGSESRN